MRHNVGVRRASVPQPHGELDAWSEMTTVVTRVEVAARDYEGFILSA
jgi:hypothetical protein